MGKLSYLQLRLLWLLFVSTCIAQEDELTALKLAGLCGEALPGPMWTKQSKYRAYRRLYQRGLVDLWVRKIDKSGKEYCPRPELTECGLTLAEQLFPLDDDRGLPSPQLLYEKALERDYRRVARLEANKPPG